MAITDLPAFTVNGILSSDYGIYALRTNDEDFPERDATNYEVPGRIGDLVVDNGRWKNKQVVYNCVCFSNPESNVPAFINAFTFTGSAVQITDTIHPEYLKIGTYKGGTKPVYKPYKLAATFDLMFDCDPRKWSRDATYGYTGEYLEISGSSRTWSTTAGNFLYRKYIAPIIRVSGASYVTFTIAGSPTIANTPRLFEVKNDCAFLYDTQTYHAYNSTGSMDSRLSSRYFPPLNIPLFKMDGTSFKIGVSYFSESSNKFAMVRMRAYTL